MAVKACDTLVLSFMSRWLLRALIVLCAFESVFASERVNENEVELSTLTPSDSHSVTVINPMQDIEATPIYPAIPVIRAQVIQSLRIVRINNELVEPEVPHQENQQNDSQELQRKDMCNEATKAFCDVASALGACLLISTTCCCALLCPVDNNFFEDSEVDIEDIARLESMTMAIDFFDDSTEFNGAVGSQDSAVPAADFYADDVAVSLDLPAIDEATVTTV